MDDGAAVAELCGTDSHGTIDRSDPEVKGQGRFVTMDDAAELR